MRKQIWVLTVTGAIGLAWVASAVAQKTISPSSPSRTASAKRGAVHYFSRDGKNSLDTQSANPTKSNDASEEAAEPAHQRYVRSKGKALANPAVDRSEADQSAGKVRNYSRQLFGDDQLPPAGSLADGKRKTLALPEESPIQTASHSEPVSAEVDESLPVKASDRKLPSPIVNAAHEQSDAAENKYDVEQISASSAAPSGEKPQTTAAAKRPIPELSDLEVIRPEAGPTAPPPPPEGKSKPTSVAKPTVAPKLTVTAPAPKPKPAAVVAAPAKTLAPATRAVAPDQKATAPVVAIINGPQPTVSLQWVAHGDVSVGQECKCGLVVKNTSSVAAKDVVVEASFPGTVRLVHAEPFPAETQERLGWTFASLAPGESKTIEITMIPSQRGDLATSASVRFTGSAANVLKVEEPQIKVTIQGPQEVSVGEAAAQTVTVTNPGSGVAKDVTIEAIIPDGLEHAKGKKVTMSVGSLSPGESRSVRLALAAVGGGMQNLVVQARGAANLEHGVVSKIKVIAPSLALVAGGPSLRYVDRKAHYSFTVTNNGSAATNNVRVVESLPEGFEFLSADKGGKFDWSNKSVSWFIGRMEPGQSVQLALESKPKKLGSYIHKVKAYAENGPAAESQVETKVDGTAELVMDVVDLDDPVEVGVETGYEIRVRNDGSKSAANVSIACELPQGVTLVEAQGPTSHVAEKGLLVFKGLKELAPQQTSTYTVRVKGKSAGHLRFQARLTSDASSEPIVAEELTKFYQD
jgi:uncharacterized repeat protein (TIGR01451 family)